MNRRFLASMILGVAMTSAMAVTGALTPKQKVADFQERFVLGDLIPEQFGDWRLDNSVLPLTPDESQKALIATLYDQTLARTYVNRAGERVMLSIAYGGDQSKQLQLHLPEVCYVAQGFDLIKESKGELFTPFGIVPVKRLVARLNTRNEPITYWITVGDKAVMSGLAQKYERFLVNLTGKIPDGMLVRVSTVDANDGEAYRIQERFVTQMLGALSPKGRSRLLGAATVRG